MAEPIYKLYMLKYQEAGYELSMEEQQKILVKMTESLESVGAETIINCNAIWSSEPWMAFGVQRYPDIEAVQKHAAQLMEFEWYRYVEAITLLGTETKMG